MSKVAVLPCPIAYRLRETSMMCNGQTGPNACWQRRNQRNRLTFRGLTSMARFSQDDWKADRRKKLIFTTSAWSGRTYRRNSLVAVDVCFVQVYKLGSDALNTRCSVKVYGIIWYQGILHTPQAVLSIPGRLPIILSNPAKQRLYLLRWPNESRHLTMKVKEGVKDCINEASCQQIFTVVGVHAPARSQNSNDIDAFGFLLRVLDLSTSLNIYKEKSRIIELTYSYYAPSSSFLKKKDSFASELSEMR